MLNERYQVSGAPVSPAYEGERITGYIIGLSRKFLNVIDKYGEGCLVAVDPDTIEPVRVKPIRYQKSYHECPNCQAYVHDQYPHCPDCGMALDWNEVI